MRDYWLGTLVTLLLSGLVAAQAIDAETDPENVLVFNYAHRGILYGDGPAQPQQWTGYVIINNDSGLAASLMVSGEEKEVELWGVNPAMGYVVDAGHQSDYIVYNNGGVTGAFGAFHEGDTFSYSHAIGRIHPRAIEIGGGLTATVAPSLTGTRKFFISSITDYAQEELPGMLYFEGKLAARYNHALTLKANGENGEAFLDDLLTSLGFDIEGLPEIEPLAAPAPKPKATAVPADHTPEILCYLIREREADFGDGETYVTNYSGIYIVDMVTGDAITLWLWRYGGNWWFDVTDDFGELTITDQLQYAGGQYFFSLIPWWDFENGYDQSFGMQYMYGRLTPDVNIGGGFVADVPARLVGNTYDHWYNDGEIAGEGYFLEAKRNASILLTHTRYFNDEGLGLEQVLDWFIDNVVPDGAYYYEDEDEEEF